MGTLQNNLGTFAALALAVAACAPAAFGQTQPTRPSAASPGAAAAPSTGDAQIVSPYWNGSQQGSNVRQTPTTPDDLLAATVTAVPAAHATAVEARLNFRRIDSELNRTADTLRRDFLDSDDYARAVENLRAAHVEYDRARNEATSGLRETEEYRAAMSLHQDANEQIAREREAENPDPQRLVALAELKLSYVLPLRNVEREQIEASDGVRSARDRLRAAAAEVARLERDFTHQARESTDLVQLRRSREDAKIAMLTTDTYYRETRSARNIALRYAYYSRDLNYGIGRYGQGAYNGGYYGGFGYGGFGGGYGSFTGLGALPIGYTGGLSFGYLR